MRTRRRTLRALGWALATGLGVSLTGCGTTSAVASYQAAPIDATGKVASSETTMTTPDGISVTAGEIEGFASPYIGAVLLTLSNQSSDFVEVDSVSLAFGGELDKHVTFPAGEDISSWGSAMNVNTWYWQRHVVEYSPLKDILTDIQRFDQSRLTTTPKPELPSEHLLAGPFSIPPALFTRRWILIKSDSNIGTCLERMIVTLNVARRPPERLLVQFRDKALTQSEWQQKECAAAAPKNGWGV